MNIVHANWAQTPDGSHPEIVVHTHSPWNALVGFLSPFRLIALDGEELWEVRKEDACWHKYDYVRLNRVTGTITADLGGKKSIHVGFDGSIVIRRDYLDSIDETTHLINQFLGRLLFGGIYCEAIEHIELSPAILMDSGYVRLLDSAVTARGMDHSQLRTGYASVVDLAELWKPDMERFDDFKAAYHIGERVFEAVRPVSADLVLRGMTSLIRRGFASALVNLWTVSEQCIELLWNRFVLLPAKSRPEVESRCNFLRDTRTWTSSAKLELLYQKALLDTDTYSSLSRARRTRNKLVHEGIHPDMDAADSAADGTMRLMSLVLTNCARSTEFLELLAHYRSMDGLRNRVTPQVVRREDVGPEGGYFLPVPAIPGEPEWEKKGSDYPYPVVIMQREWPDAQPSENT